MSGICRMKLFDLPEAIEVELAGYLNACDIVTLYKSGKKAAQYNRPVIWRELLSIMSGTKTFMKGKKHKKKGISKNASSVNFYKELFIDMWKAVVSGRRKELISALLSSYDADMKLSIHKECIRSAEAATKSCGLLINQKQSECTHNRMLLIHLKTIYPTTAYYHDSRESILNKSCSNCSSMCYEKMVYCACCKDSHGISSNACCLPCNSNGDFAGHNSHPKIEFTCPRDYFLSRDYTVGCFDCGIAYAVRVASSYKLRWEKPASNYDHNNRGSVHLTTAEFLCPSRQNVFRNMLLNCEGKAELLFRMKKGDMLLNNTDEALQSNFK